MSVSCSFYFFQGSEQFVLGYTMKWKGNFGFRHLFRGYTEEEIEEARQYYNSTKNALRKKFKVLTKNGIFADAFAFAQSFFLHLPVIPSLATTVQCMIQSGKWALSATWASRANVMDENRAEALWASVMAPHQVTS